MIDGQPEGAAREASLWARAWAWWKAWRRPRKHFFVNSLVTVYFGLIFMLDIRLIAGLFVIAVILDADTFLAGQDRAKGEAKIPFWLTLKPTFYLFGILAIAIPILGPLFRNACLSADSVWAKMFGLALWKIEDVGGLCAYPYSTYIFFIESLVHMLIIFNFYFCNYVIQRNIYAMYVYVNIDKAIDRAKKAKLKKFILIIYSLCFSHLYSFWLDMGMLKIERECLYRIIMWKRLLYIMYIILLFYYLFFSTLEPMRFGVFLNVRHL